MIQRRTVSLAALSAMGAGLPLAVRAQASPKRPVIGVLGNQDNPPWEGFRRGLRELGRVERDSVAIEWRWTDGYAERVQPLLAELVALNVDVIVTSSTLAARAARDATSRIPIVMALSSYPDRLGIVASLARPGGNVTGLTNVSADLMGKRLELLKAMLPSLRRVAFVGSANLVEQIARPELTAAGAALELEVAVVEARTPEEIPAALDAALVGRSQALLVSGNPVNFKARARILEFALERRLLGMFDERLFVDEGGLMSYAPNSADLFRRAAGYVDRILKGARPADLPIEQPTMYEFVINVKTAQAIGVTVPPALRLRADQLIG